MLQKPKHNRPKKGIILYFVIALIVGVINVIAWNSTAFSDAYIKYIFPVWVNTYGRITGLFPFSVGEILLVLGVLSVLLCFFTIIIILLLVAYRLLAGKRYAPSVNVSSLWRFSKGYLCWFSWVVLIVCVIMTLNCTILYQASTFSQQYYGEEEGNYTVEDLIKVRNLVVEKCNELSVQISRDAEGNPVYEGDFEEKAIEAMKKLGTTYDQLDGYYPRPKPLVASDFFSQQYIAGYYFPFSMEANYNQVMYITNMPSSMCHELAHLRGYIFEDEAYFISYLACIQSEDTFFEYCGYLSVLYYLDNDFYDAVRGDYEAYFAQPVITARVHADNIFLTDEEWDRINGKAVIDTETVDEISDTFTDTVLKVNGVEDGMISYSRVVELLLWYYSQQ